MTTSSPDPKKDQKKKRKESLPQQRNLRGRVDILGVVLGMAPVMMGVLGLPIVITRILMVMNYEDKKACRLAVKSLPR